MPTNFTSAIASGLQGPEWLRGYRTSAFAQLDARPLPVPDEELWRYSRIDKLDLDKFLPAPTEPALDGVPGSAADLLEAIGVRASVVLTWNGTAAHLQSDDSLAAKGVRVSSSGSWADGDGFGAAAGSSDDYFTTMNTAFGPDPVVIDIPRGVVVEQPIVVIHYLHDDGVVAFPRLLVRMGEQSQATVLECMLSEDVEAVTVPVTELVLGQDSNLQYVNVQTLAESVWQLGAQYSRVERDATLVSTSVALGGDYARVTTESHLVGAGASSKLNAVFFGNDSQMHDFRTLQGHEAPKSTSDLLFKGALGGSARSVYSGLIRVRKGAAGTNAYQTNRNLVLSSGAHADSVPNLEIEENDVRCSHASAVGPIDEDQRYYLESRGVPTDVAERLIVLGFLDELLQQVGIPGLHERLREAVARKLDALVAS